MSEFPYHQQGAGETICASEEYKAPPLLYQKRISRQASRIFKYILVYLGSTIIQAGMVRFFFVNIAPIPPPGL
ncbi:hypothetical protein [Bradyrhizobium sp.]|uniref:hypothetical protein n=1 Tax=Bradyrhizobium sp. TaxID=376 RepID=UPI002624FBB4|nr:hypothetical protein [Bradyrhizobium sp.]